MTSRFSHLSPITKYLFIFCVIAVIAMPFIASGQEDDTTTEAKGLVACSDDKAPGCTLCQFFQTIHNVINFLFTVIVLPLTAIVFLIGGVLLLTSGGNETQVTRGKSILWNTFIGILVAFGAWLIINTLLVNISPGTIPYSASGEEVSLKWWEFPGCIEGTEPPLPIVGGTPPFGDGGGSGGETCSEVSTGPCSVSNLQSTCFGNNASNASKICQGESSGNPNAAGDKCNLDGSLVSIGLFQINISAHKIDGLDCPSAFNRPLTGGNKNCRVINQTLYNDCVAAAKNPSKNIQKACELSSNGNNFSDDWKNISNKCGIN